VPFSCFALPKTFPAVPRVSGPVFLFCAPELVFRGTEGVRSRFHALRDRTYFWWYRGCRFPFSCFARTDSFSAVPRASGPNFMFCAPRMVSAVPKATGPIFNFCAPGVFSRGTESVGTRFHILRAHSFSAVPRVWGTVFMFCATGVILNGIEGVGSLFHVLRSRKHFRRYRGRQVRFSNFALPDSFSAVTRTSGPFFMFCPPELIFGGTEAVGSRYQVLRS
jgi:hypothetical protein